MRRINVAFAWDYLLQLTISKVFLTRHFPGSEWRKHQWNYTTTTLLHSPLSSINGRENIPRLHPQETDRIPPRWRVLCVANRWFSVVSVIHSQLWRAQTRHESLLWSSREINSHAATTSTGTSASITALKRPSRHLSTHHGTWTPITAPQHPSRHLSTQHGTWAPITVLEHSSPSFPKHGRHYLSTRRHALARADH